MSGNFAQLLQPASFRAISFFIFDAETAFGRRNILHEYPYRDTPYAEDLGRKGREFSMNAYVMITSNFSNRDALIAAIELDSTPGTLIHPTLGTLQVIPKDCKHRYNNMEGGIEYFELKFVEAGTNIAPTLSIDTSNASLTSASALNTASQAFFTANFQVNGLAQFIAQTAQTRLLSLGQYITNLTLYAGSINTTGTSYANFTALLTAFNASTNAMSINPTLLASNVVSLNTALTAAYISDPIAALNLQFRLVNWTLTIPAVPTTTNMRIIQAANDQLLIDLVINSSIAQMVTIVASISFASQQDAQNIQDSVEAVSSPQLLNLANAFDDDIYNSVLNAVDAMVNNIAANVGTLASASYITLQNSIPAQVLAYREYQDATRDLQLVSRNPIIINPAFVPASQESEVLL